ncbi:MAG: FAD-binding oxidoreductase [Deltaproteobacteria bacterium]|nr:FAD-binding oxidoreductase [Deltaproteobacteria bacterium]
MSGKNEFLPDWANDPPAGGSYRSIFKWGAPDAFKHPNRRLYGMLKEELHLSDDDFRKKRALGNQPVALDLSCGMEPEQVRRFMDISGPENVFSDDYARVKCGTGKTLEEALRLRHGAPVQAPDLVVHPRTAEEIEKIVALCARDGIPAYAYGGGSSVTLGLRPSRGGVCLVMTTHMNRLVRFSEINQTITVEPGMTGPQLENLLNNAPDTLNATRRYTCGHFPQSFEFSSVGGWIAALGSGQQSSYYGDMADLVVSQAYVTPAGAFKTLDYPATATGPKVNDIMKGSEGAFGVIVGATLKIFRYAPENRKRFAFIFPEWEAAVSAARDISQGEFGMPSAFRISDPEETRVAMRLYGIEGTPVDRYLSLRGLRPQNRCLFIGSADGERAFARNIRKKVKKICKRSGAVYITGLPVKKWEHGRFTDPYMREDLGDFGIIIDTLESAVTWEGFHRLHQGVRAFIKSRPRTMCMTHASHFYPQGTNLYFIFIAAMTDLEEYLEFQQGIVEQILKHGGSLSHHHGVGKMTAPWMEAHLGKAQMDVLRALKRHFDPNNIMNPGGTLGLDVADEEKRRLLPDGS